MSSIQETNLKAIADAIRAKEKSTGVIQASKFAERIAAIQTGAELSIVVASTAGSTATAVKGDITVTGTVGEDGTCTLIVPEPGTWTVTCTKDGNSASKDVIVNATYPVEIVIISIPTNLTAVTTSGLTAAEYLRCIAYGIGKFVGYGWNDDSYYYSSDGVNWTKASGPTVSSGYHQASKIRYCNDKFIGLWRDDLHAIAYSTDGINWACRTLWSGNDSWFYDVCYGNGKYVARGQDSTFAYSTNGTSWSKVTMPGTSNGNHNTLWRGLAFGNGKFVACKCYTSGEQDPRVAYSTDGINWTTVEMPCGGVNWADVAFGNGKFVLIAQGSGTTSHNNTNYIFYSEDGVNWTQAEIPSLASGDYLNKVYCVNDVFFIDTHKDIMLYSKDGITWYKSSEILPSSHYINDFIYANGKYYMLMDDANSTCVLYTA